MRRHETIFRMFLSLLGAFLFGAVLEAEGLHVWAERLNVGALRETALPITSAWQRALQPLGAGQVRALALQTKTALAPLMLGPDEPLAPNFEWQRLAALPVSVEAALAWTDVRPPLSLHGLEPRPQPERVSYAPLIATAESSAVLEAGSSLQLVLAGDSMMAVGLAPSLRRGLVADKGVHILKAYRSGTGLSRPEVFDWLEQYPQMLGAARPQLVICALGANDGQNVQVGKDVLEFASPAWDAFYRTRLSAYLDMVLATQAQVLWIAMPAMRERRFAQKMQHMNALTQSVLAAYPQVTWLDPNPSLGYADNVFAQYRANERGKLIKLRADDGIHLTDEGAAFLLAPIREWLVQAAAKTRPVAMTPEQTVLMAERAL